MSGAHRTHIARGVAGDASAAGDAQWRGAISRVDRGGRARSLGSQREQLPFEVARDANRHSGHVIGHEERALALVGRDRTVAGGLGLFGCRVSVEPSAIGRGRSGVLRELLLDGIGWPGR